MFLELSAFEPVRSTVSVSPLSFVCQAVKQTAKVSWPQISLSPAKHIHLITTVSDVSLYLLVSSCHEMTF